MSMPHATLDYLEQFCKQNNYIAFFYVPLVAIELGNFLLKFSLYHIVSTVDLALIFAALGFVSSWLLNLEKEMPMQRRKKRMKNANKLNPKEEEKELVQLTS